MSASRRHLNGRNDPETAFGGIDVWGPLLSNMQAWTRQVSDTNVGIQREWLGFIDRRLKANMALTQELAGCKAPDEVMRTYVDFMQAAFADYQKEFTTIAKFGGALAGEAIETIQAAGEQTAESFATGPHERLPSRKRQSSAPPTH